jgi:hypothetical protein
MKNKLSADPTALVLGIVSLVIVISGCCCGFLAIISLALSIVGLVSANKSLNEFYLNPENYISESRSNVNAGKIVCIIGVILSSILILISVVFFAFQRQYLSKKILEKYYESKEVQHQVEINDTVKPKVISVDSIRIDSTGVN